MRLTSAFVIPLLGTAGSVLAQPPHAGTWAINYSSSDRSEVVLGFDDLGSGLWQFSSSGRRILQFRMDDNECASCAASEPWKLIGPDTWDTGLMNYDDRIILNLAADSGSLSLITKSIARNGESIDRVQTFERLSGGPGLSGTWRMWTERSTSPPLIELSPGVEEWLVYKSPAEGIVCIFLLDGADYPCFSASLPPGRTIAMKIGETGVLAVVVKRDGKTVAESTYTVSSDGRSMTQTETSASGGGTRTVYDRQ